jgi:hypothetical protein
MQGCQPVDECYRKTLTLIGDLDNPAVFKEQPAVLPGILADKPITTN